MKQLSSSENKKSSPSELNKSNLEINRGFEFILNGGKKKQVKPFSFVFDKKAFYEEFGNESTFPQVVCDGKKLGGSVETVKFLREQKIISV